MFLELSFGSQDDDDKEVTTSKDAHQWRYQDKEEMSLDELISDFQQSATSHRKLKQSVSSSNSSPVRAASPPKLSKRKERDKKDRSFSARDHAVKQTHKTKPVKLAAKKERMDDLSDDDVAVSPMPRLDQVLRNKPSFIPKRRAIVGSSTQSRRTPVQQRKPKARSPVLSSPSLTPHSLSPPTSSSSLLSILEDNKAETPDEDSIDALIGKDIRDLNRLISTGSCELRQSRGRARSPTTDEMSTAVRQSTRFRRNKGNDHHSSLRLQLRGTSRSESPPPPPPPEDSEEEEDSFAEEIRKLRTSRRFSSVLSTKSPGKEAPNEETSPSSSEVCAIAALKVRNASNAISELLLEALKPFGDKQREEEEEKTTEDEESGAIRNAATAELPSATRTIVSQLDLAFAEMTEQRKADLKAEADTVAAAKDAEKKEREAADEKKKTEEKATKEREMEILRRIPMQGKLLACSTDIEHVLNQLEGSDTVEPSDLEAEIKALRNATELKIQAIDLQISTKASKQNHSDRGDGISWQAVDWIQTNVEMAPGTPSKRTEERLKVTEREEAVPEENEEPFERILHLQVLEKLDLTMLKLKHVLAIDTKEAAEAKEKEQQERKEEAKILAQQNVDDERKKLEREDAMNARRRVMGLTSVDEVEGWIEEGRQLWDEVGYERSLNRLLTSMESCSNQQNQKNRCTNSENFVSKRAGALHQFDGLPGVVSTATENKPDLGRTEASPVHSVAQPRWIEIARSPSDSESDEDNARGEFPSDTGSPSFRIVRRHRKQRGMNDYCRDRCPPISSSPRRLQEIVPNSRELTAKRYYDNETFHDKGFLKDHRRDGRLTKQKTRERRSRHQQEVARTIQALQVERRQKATWIRSRVWSPSTGRYPL
ncbi:hypothetical protein P3T76_006656 [Phytophthora citrophthora]|uniref:Uncharacterized protein n=1 Tax=Phytophthora citrophthora TaxID=4793 RepID=A0AAD9GPR9_9STRA|nr:hypothetical protein P3T76_006656 [Phytophthora citrophthora]